MPPLLSTHLPGLVGLHEARTLELQIFVMTHQALSTVFVEMFLVMQGVVY